MDLVDPVRPHRSKPTGSSQFIESEAITSQWPTGHWIRGYHKLVPRHRMHVLTLLGHMPRCLPCEHVYVSTTSSRMPCHASAIQDVPGQLREVKGAMSALAKIFHVNLRSGLLMVLGNHWKHASTWKGTITSQASYFQPIKRRQVSNDW